MKKRGHHSGEIGDSRWLALAVGRGEVGKWMAAEASRLAEFEAGVERAPISPRRGRWLERTVPVWAAQSKARFAQARRKWALALWLGGAGKRLRALEARKAAAYARLLERVAEERAKGWPRKTVYAERPEL